MWSVESKDLRLAAMMVAPMASYLVCLWEEWTVGTLVLWRESSKVVKKEMR